MISIEFILAVILTFLGFIIFLEGGIFLEKKIKNLDAYALFKFFH